GVVYEFIDADADNDHPDNLLTPAQLHAGKTYAMVVSDAYGLRRYQTGDLFECRRIATERLPDLAFLRRRALEYSFVGEKVTADQLNAVFTQLRAEHPELNDGFLTCVPSLLPIPHYKLVFIGAANNGFAGDLLASECDKLLSTLNCEYNSKRARSLLAPIAFVQTDPADFASRFSDSWESQFKFLPLYRRTWESTDVPQLNASNLSLSDTDTRQLAQTTSLQ
ncbi:MAG TPA: GH3 auxin-responsive promoter family protein, partial [Pyrinomonadaceae bacterium]|nr:GH3 auxin-responsive promoter family protein [Pyrinomonadaceae bacterium]